MATVPGAYCPYRWVSRMSMASWFTVDSNLRAKKVGRANCCGKTKTKQYLKTWAIWYEAFYIYSVVLLNSPGSIRMRSCGLKSLGEQPHQSTMCLYWHLQPSLRFQLVTRRLLSTRVSHMWLFPSTVWKKDWREKKTKENDTFLLAQTNSLLCQSDITINPRFA